MSGQAILYAAKSTEDIHGSIPTQLEDGRRLAEQEGLEVVAEYSDEAASAYKGDRGPELAAALEHAERIGGTLIVQHSDRLARGDGKQARHLAELFFFANRAGVTLRSVQDDSTFQNPVLAVVMGERNMEDSRRKSLAIKAGMARRRKRGLYNGGFTPYGYLLRRNEDDERVLVIDEERAPWVRRIFDLFLAGESYADIARTLEAEGAPSYKGESLWSHYTVRKIVRNHLFAGLIRDGEELIEAAHEAIIDRETWEKVVALREAKARTHKRGRPPAGKHLFRKGFLKCGMCGEDMSPLTYRDRPHPTDQIYRCLGRKRHSHTCDMSAVYRSDVDGAVYAYFQDLGLDAEATREQLLSAREQSLAEAREVLDSAEQETQAATERLERIKRDYVSGELTATEWRGLRQELEPELSAAQAEEERLRERLEEAESESALSKITTALLAQLSEIRTEITKEVTDVKEAAAVRAALMRLFDGFVLHSGSPRHETRESTKVAYWLEPVLSQHQMSGYVDRLRKKSPPKGGDDPHGQAKNNLDASIGRLRERGDQACRPLGCAAAAAAGRRPRARRGQARRECGPRARRRWAGGPRARRVRLPPAARRRPARRPVADVRCRWGARATAPLRRRQRRADRGTGSRAGCSRARARPQPPPPARPWPGSSSSALGRNRRSRPRRSASHRRPPRHRAGGGCSQPAPGLHVAGNWRHPPRRRRRPALRSGRHRRRGRLASVWPPPAARRPPCGSAQALRLHAAPTPRRAVPPTCQSRRRLPPSCLHLSFDSPTSVHQEDDRRSGRVTSAPSPARPINGPSASIAAIGSQNAHPSVHQGSEIEKCNAAIGGPAGCHICNWRRCGASFQLHVSAVQFGSGKRF